ncbi:MAG: hypothetical protein AVDCRST_MAG64-331, partial [uncultured Phycisphaerae bacterium]
ENHGHRHCGRSGHARFELGRPR